MLMPILKIVSFCAYQFWFIFWFSLVVAGVGRYLAFLRQLFLNVKSINSPENRNQKSGYSLQISLVIIALETHALSLAFCILNYLLLRGSKGKEVNFYPAPYSTFSPKIFSPGMRHLCLSPIRLEGKIHLIIYTSALGSLCERHLQHHYKYTLHAHKLYN